jgi:hypothetical protein
MKKLNKAFDFLELRQNVFFGGRNMANKSCFTYCNALFCPRYYEHFCPYDDYRRNSIKHNVLCRIPFSLQGFLHTVKNIFRIERKNKQKTKR